MAGEIDYSVFQRSGAAGAASERRDRFDGYVNPLTLIGDHCADKTFGGQVGNLPFIPAFLSGGEIEARWSGSDLGARIIESIPLEMVRGWFDLLVQPSESDTAPAPASLTAELEAKAADLTSAGHLDAAAIVYGLLATLPRAPRKDGKIDDGAEIVEALAAKSKKLGVRAAFLQALQYEQAYGGAAILLGCDEGGIAPGRPLRLDSAEDRRTSGCDASALSGRKHLDATDPNNLTDPLDLKRVKSVTHLNVYTGGWDGELIAWRYYGDKTGPKYGMPEIYMLRNLGVPPSGPNAPGERMTPVMNNAAPTYIHESRLLIFPGIAASPRVRQWNRGWGTSIWCRIEEVLRDFNQTWGGVALLMQELEIKSLGIEGFMELATGKDKVKKAYVKDRAKELVRSFSIARMYIHDSKEELKRNAVSLAGVADVLHEFILRLAAAANMPVSLLMGQVQGGLGDASAGDLTFFYDRVLAWEEMRMVPQAERLHEVLFATADSPTGGEEPERWSIVLRPLKQMTPTERATRDKTIADTDNAYYTMGAVSAEEIRRHRFGGSEFNDGPLVINPDAPMEAPPPPAPVAPGEPPVVEPDDAPPARADAEGEGRWVTMEGESVFIKGGKITKGPAAVVGKKPSEIPPRSTTQPKPPAAPTAVAPSKEKPPAVPTSPATTHAVQGGHIALEHSGLSKEVQSVIEKFAKENQQYATKEGAAWNCPVATGTLNQALAKIGEKGQMGSIPAHLLEQHYGKGKGAAHSGHVATVINGVVIDFTARQYIPNAPFPLVYKLSEVSHEARSWLHEKTRAAGNSDAHDDEKGAGFVEGDHPRAENGQFGEGGSGATATHGGGEEEEAPVERHKASYSPASTTPTARKMVAATPTKHDPTPAAGKMKSVAGAKPGSQLPQETQDRLKALGITKLPAAHVSEVHVSNDLHAAGDAVNQHALIKWKDDKGRPQSSYTPEFDKRNAEEKFKRVLENRPKLETAIPGLREAAQHSPPHAAALLIAQTGLRPGSNESLKAEGHYGVTTMEARHVTFAHDGAHIGYIGKEGVHNVAHITDHATVEALRKNVAGKAPTDRVFKGVDNGKIAATLPAGVKVKDMRTTIATTQAEGHLSGITPTLTGDAKTDARHIMGLLKGVSESVSKTLNNTPEMARKSYIAPQIIQAWGAKHNVPKEWL